MKKVMERGLVQSLKKVGSVVGSVVDSMVGSMLNDFRREVGLRCRSEVALPLLMR